MTMLFRSTSTDNKNKAKYAHSEKGGTLEIEIKLGTHTLPPTPHMADWASFTSAPIADMDANQSTSLSLSPSVPFEDKSSSENIEFGGVSGHNHIQNQDETNGVISPTPASNSNSGNDEWADFAEARWETAERGGITADNDNNDDFGGFDDVGEFDIVDPVPVELNLDNDGNNNYNGTPEAKSNSNLHSLSFEESHKEEVAENGDVADFGDENSKGSENEVEGRDRDGVELELNSNPNTDTGDGGGAMVVEAEIGSIQEEEEEDKDKEEKIKWPDSDSEVEVEANTHPVDTIIPKHTKENEGESESETGEMEMEMEMDDRTTEKSASKGEGKGKSKIKVNIPVDLTADRLAEIDEMAKNSRIHHHINIGFTSRDSLERLSEGEGGGEGEGEGGGEGQEKEGEDIEMDREREREREEGNSENQSKEDGEGERERRGEREGEGDGAEHEHEHEHSMGISLDLRIPPGLRVVHSEGPGSSAGLSTVSVSAQAAADDASVSDIRSMTSLATSMFSRHTNRHGDGDRHGTISPSDGSSMGEREGDGEGERGESKDRDHISGSVQDIASEMELEIELAMATMNRDRIGEQQREGGGESDSRAHQAHSDIDQYAYNSTYNYENQQDTMSVKSWRSALGRWVAARAAIQDSPYTSPPPASSLSISTGYGESGMGEGEGDGEGEGEGDGEGEGEGEGESDVGEGEGEGVEDGLVHFKSSAVEKEEEEAKEEKEGEKEERRAEEKEREEENGNGDADEFGDFADFESAPITDGAVEENEEVKEGEGDGDGFGEFDDFESAPIGVEKVKEEEEKVEDEFGDFADFESAPVPAAASTTNTTPTTTAAAAASTTVMSDADPSRSLFFSCSNGSTEVVRSSLMKTLNTIFAPGKEKGKEKEEEKVDLKGDSYTLDTFISEAIPSSWLGRCHHCSSALPHRSHRCIVCGKGTTMDMDDVHGVSREIFAASQLRRFVFHLYGVSQPGHMSMAKSPLQLSPSSPSASASASSETVNVKSVGVGVGVENVKAKENVKVKEKGSSLVIGVSEYESGGGIWNRRALSGLLSRKQGPNTTHTQTAHKGISESVQAPSTGIVSPPRPYYQHGQRAVGSGREEGSARAKVKGEVVSGEGEGEDGFVMVQKETEKEAVNTNTNTNANRQDQDHTSSLGSTSTVKANPMEIDLLNLEGFVIDSKGTTTTVDNGSVSGSVATHSHSIDLLSSLLDGIGGGGGVEGVEKEKKEENEYSDLLSQTLFDLGLAPTASASTSHSNLGEVNGSGSGGSKGASIDILSLFAVDSKVKGKKVEGKKEEKVEVVEEEEKVEVKVDDFADFESAPIEVQEEEKEDDGDGDGFGDFAGFESAPITDGAAEENEELKEGDGDGEGDGFGEFADFESAPIGVEEKEVEEEEKVEAERKEEEEEEKREKHDDKSLVIPNDGDVSESVEVEVVESEKESVSVGECEKVSVSVDDAFKGLVFFESAPVSGKMEEKEEEKVEEEDDDDDGFGDFAAFESAPINAISAFSQAAAEAEAEQAAEHKQTANQESYPHTHVQALNVIVSQDPEVVPDHHHVHHSPPPSLPVQVPLQVTGDSNNSAGSGSGSELQLGLEMELSGVGGGEVGGAGGVVYSGGGADVMGVVSSVRQEKEKEKVKVDEKWSDLSFMLSHTLVNYRR